MHKQCVYQPLFHCLDALDTRSSSAVFAGIDRVCVYVCVCRKNCVQEAGETDSHCDADSDGRCRGTIRD